MKINEQKRLNLFRIEQARFMLNYNIENDIITEGDIISILKLDSNFALNKKNTNYKTKVLRDIYNSPFILCDQKNLSLDFKKILPIILNTRYLIELEELNLMYKKGYIDKDEYTFEEKMLKFNYYQSSEDGKNILKTGHVSNVLDNTSKYKIYINK